jgi:hypothetical protein
MPTFLAKLGGRGAVFKQLATTKLASIHMNVRILQLFEDVINKATTLDAQVLERERKSHSEARV